MLLLRYILEMVRDRDIATVINCTSSIELLGHQWCLDV